MKNTITTTSQATANFLTAADKIMNLMDELGFTSDQRQDPNMIRHTVAQIIRESIEGNVYYGVDCSELEVPRHGREDYVTYDLGGPCDCQCGCCNERQPGE